MENKLVTQREKLNNRFNKQLYDFLDWCGKTFPWIKDFIIYRDIVWGYTKMFKHKLIKNWYKHVAKNYKKEILAEKKTFFINLEKHQMMSRVEDQDQKKILESFDFDKVLHFKELFSREDFPKKHEQKIWTNMQILNHLSEKFKNTDEELGKLAF